MASYKDIQASLLQRIKSGEWRPGVLLPAEADLATEFGSTRVTVNRAMQALADAGYVERRRKAGTRVVQRTVREALVRIPVVRQEIERRGERYHYLRLKRTGTRPPAAIAARLGMASGERALHVLSLHFADGHPHQLEDRWINLDVVPQARGEPFEDTSPNEWLVETIPYTSAEHVLRAAMPNAGERRYLDMGADEPVFVIERTTWIDDRTVTHVKLSHPAAGFRLVTRDLA